MPEENLNQTTIPSPPPPPSERGDTLVKKTFKFASRTFLLPILLAILGGAVGWLLMPSCNASDFAIIGCAISGALAIGLGLLVGFFIGLVWVSVKSSKENLVSPQGQVIASPRWFRLIFKIYGGCLFGLVLFNFFFRFESGSSGFGYEELFGASSLVFVLGLFSYLFSVFILGVLGFGGWYLKSWFVRFSGLFLFVNAANTFLLVSSEYVLFPKIFLFIFFVNLTMFVLAYFKRRYFVDSKVNTWVQILFIIGIVLGLFSAVVR